MYTPAITIVLLCSKADMGVGADIALMSQSLYGSWADFVKNMVIRAMIR